MDNLNQIRGWIFNIQSYSIHDGPGVRTTVFLSGCPLWCRWCQNPESNTVLPELFFLAEKCTGCGSCRMSCPQNVIEIKDDKSSTDRTKCTACGSCVPVCPNGAREIIGEEKSAGEIVETVCRDKIFFDGSGGGITLSGGEVLTQSAFASAILELSKKAGLHTAIETSGYGPWTSFSEILKYTDLVLYDFKHMDNESHRYGTGVGNELILENAVRVCREAKKAMAARVPVIPGFNDTKDNMEALARFITERLDPAIKIHLLPYHRLGESKDDRLEKTIGRFRAKPPSDEHLEYLRMIIADHGLDAVIGG